MRGFSGRLPWSWTTNVEWNIDGIMWRCMVKAPSDVLITKQRYWAYYDPRFHEFVIAGTENKNVVYDIEDALQTKKSTKTDGVLGCGGGRDETLK